MCRERLGLFYKNKHTKKTSYYHNHVSTPTYGLNRRIHRNMANTEQTVGLRTGTKSTLYAISELLQSQSFSAKEFTQWLSVGKDNWFMLGNPKTPDDLTKNK